MLVADVVPNTTTHTIPLPLSPSLSLSLSQTRTHTHIHSSICIEKVTKVYSNQIEKKKRKCIFIYTNTIPFYLNESNSVIACMIDSDLPLTVYGGYIRKYNIIES